MGFLKKQFGSGGGGGGGSATFAGLTDAETADLPSINEPLAEALGAKLDRTDRIANYQRAISTNGFTRRSILFIGDSLFGQVITDLRTINQAELDESDMAWCDGAFSGGASIALDACVKWITGSTFLATASGHTITFGNVGTFPVAGNTLKVYCLKQSGGGVFKVQYERTFAGVTDAWADASTTRGTGVANGTTAITFASTGVIPPTGMIITGTNIAANTYVVSATLTSAVLSQNASGSGSGITFTFGPNVETANASNLGHVVTIPKEDYRAKYRVRAVWVSGSVNVIGAGVIDTNRYGAKVAIMTNASSTSPNNNIDAMATTAAAIINPIFADLAPQLCHISVLDSAATITSSLSTVQDHITTAITSAAAPTPSWVIVGPPMGNDAAQDLLNAATEAAMKVVAEARGDEFFPNRLWMGDDPTEAVANGYMLSNDVHPTAKAKAYWIPALYRHTGIAEGLILGHTMQTALRIIGSAVLRGQSGAIGANSTAEFLGILRVANPDGEKDKAHIILEEMTGGANANAAGFFRRRNGSLEFGSTLSSVDMIISAPIGQGLIYNPQSTAANPNGSLGISTNPFRDLYVASVNLGYVEKTANYILTTNDYTVNVISGSPTITLPTATAQGRIYVITNTGVGTVTLATTSSQTIDAIAPGTILAGGSIKIQATGTQAGGARWISIP